MYDYWQDQPDKHIDSKQLQVFIDSNELTTSFTLVFIIQKVIPYHKYFKICIGEKLEQQQGSHLSRMYYSHFLYYDAYLKYKYQNLHPAKFWRLNKTPFNVNAFKYFNALDQYKYVTTLDSPYVLAAHLTPYFDYLVCLYRIPLCLYLGR